METKTKVIIGILCALVLFVLISVCKCAFTPVDASQDSSIEATESEESAEEKSLLGDTSVLTDEQIKALTRINAFKWISDSGDMTLAFDAESMTTQYDGQEPKTVPVVWRTVYAIGDDGTLGPADATVLTCTIDGNESLIYFRLKELNSKALTQINNVIYANNEKTRAYVMNVTALSNTMFIPYERTQFTVETGDMAARLLGDDLEKAEHKIEQFCIENYPTANKATWRKVATIDYNAGVYALYYDLNDSALSSVTVLYKEDGSVDVEAGENSSTKGYEDRVFQEEQEATRAEQAAKLEAEAKAQEEARAQAEAEAQAQAQAQQTQQASSQSTQVQSAEPEIEYEYVYVYEED